jgi:signal transduction histidine kinase
MKTKKAPLPPGKNRQVHNENRYVLLYELFHSISAALEPRKALNLIIDAAVKITGATNGSLILIDWEKRVLNIEVSRGFSKRIEDTRLKVGEGITGWVAENGRPLLVPDVAQDPRYFPIQAEIQSELAVPLIIDHQVIGVLNVDSTQKNAFTVEDLDLLTLFAKQSARVIQNGQLYERMVTLEEQTRRAERLTSVGELAVGIAHEIRNPLTIVKMIFDSGEELNRRDREVISEELARMDTIITHLLDYARPREAVRELCKTRRILENALFLISHEYEQKNITVETNFADNLPKILADPVQLQQVFLNLLINSGEAMPPGGRIYLRTAQADEHTIEVTIEDNGEGMPEEVMKNLFTPFTTTKPKGLGLGLSIVKRIIDSHQGQIEITSAPIVGTRVKIRLPVG